MLESSRRDHTLVLYMICGLLALRVASLLLSPLGLHGDEAQYWAWSKELAWGYVTKPPLIAGVIAATTSIFSDAEWAVRLASPLLHSLTAWVIYLTARKLYGSRTALWAAALFILMPAIWLSSGIISTDVPLLLCWVTALNAWVHLRESASWKRALQLGLALGLGTLAKYAMLFFLPALILTLVIDRPTRRALLSLNGLVVLVVASAIIMPNMLWNLQNEFVTFSHTAANANLADGARFHPAKLGAFWRDQLIVFGPVSFICMGGALIAAIIARFKRSKPTSLTDTSTLPLVIFTLTPLLIISAQALISRANANWAVTAYIAAAIITAHYGLNLHAKWKLFFKRGVIIQSVLALCLALVLLIPPATNALGLSNSVKRLRAWPQTVSALEKIYVQGHDGQAFEAAATDRRILYYNLKYYGLAQTTPLYMWRYTAHIQNQAELKAPLPALKGPVLLINHHDDYADEFRQDFARLSPLPTLELDLGGGKKRVLKLWAGYDYTPTQNR